MTTTEIDSIALLVFFIFYFLFQLKTLSKRRTLLSRYRNLKKLKRLSWDNFEQLTMELFEKQGWSVHGNEKKGADGGVDIWMYKKYLIYKNISAIVQCKRYDESMVTIKVVREMYGLMHEYEVDEVYIVTTSRFTKECYKFIKQKKIVLIDGETLVRMINR